MLRKPFFRALYAAAYIAIIVLVINSVTSSIEKDTIIIPMIMLSLLVLSVTIMAFLFGFEPFRLYGEGKKHEALRDFTQTVAIFAAFVAVFVILLFLNL